MLTITPFRYAEPLPVGEPVGEPLVDREAELNALSERALAGPSPVATRV
jgi:hypothetical protein